MCLLVEIDEKSGFCFGVVKAISTAENFISGSIDGGYCLGDIVHNRIEVSRLESLGLKTIKLSDFSKIAGKTMLIRAHGEPPSTYELAKQYNIKLIDATCPVVASLQKKVVTAYHEMQKIGGQVVILGKRGHAEVIGLTGQVGEDAIVIEGIDDFNLIDFTKPIYLLSQTTQSLTLFNDICKLISERSINKFVINDTICRQVSNRNPHLSEFAKKYDVVIFVSGKKSSNGKALFKVCLESNPRSYNIESPDELNNMWFDSAKSVGICGATSTPKWLMEKIAKIISEKR